MPSVYRLYLDESGDHKAPTGPAVGQRYLGLAGVIMSRSDTQALADGLEAIKRQHLEYDADDVPIMHRVDIKARRGAFSVLTDPARAAAFDDAVVALVGATPMRVVCVVIDKETHGTKKYRQLTHPYHYSLLGMLQRYCGWLAFAQSRGDVMAEARGTAEDVLLKQQYDQIYHFGGLYLQGHVCRATLTSKELKLKPKRLNIAGLQLADLLAHPLTRDVLVAYGRIPDHGSQFAAKLAAAVRPKYNSRAAFGQIKGYGQVLLA